MKTVVAQAGDIRCKCWYKWARLGGNESLTGKLSYFLLELSYFLLELSYFLLELSYFLLELSYVFLELALY
jgi:hypothetical protein